MTSKRRHPSPAFAACVIFAFASMAAGESEPKPVGLDVAPWKQDGLVQQIFRFQGTGARNNPLRRKLAATFSGNELFVRFRIRYAADSIDTPKNGNGEFIVLWLDSVEGGATSTHSGGVPNLGIHVNGDENRFMARFASGREQHAAKLVGDRDFLVIGRLSKSKPGASAAFDSLSLWVDPKSDDLAKPHASVTSAKSISQVSWIGFATGVKTELEDRIDVWDIDVSDTWQKIVRLPMSRTPKPNPPPEPTVAFVKDVLPILKSKCFACHSGEDAVEGHRLDVLDEVINHTSPRSGESSQLFRLAASGKMPREGAPLNEKQLAVLKAWIDEGLDWDEATLPTPIPKSDHWAFQPVHRPAVPKVKNAGWIRSPVDAFIARKHEQLGIAPAPEAAPATLARRLSLDMLGLPPSAVSSELTVAGVLADPAYGERWGRHWLDVARWAESNGHQHNRHRPFAWRYRDWVVRAFNNDLPFDQFVRMQVAGDELQPYSNDNIVATGFLAAARYSGNELDKDIQRNDILVDITNTTAQAFVGLTMECAQCHTHKFDPISIRDYYRFQAFFGQGQPGNVVLAAREDSRDGRQALLDERQQIFDAVHARLVEVKRRQRAPEPILVIPKTVLAAMKGDEKARFNQLEQQIKQLPQTWSFYSPVTASQRLHVAPHEMRFPLPNNPSLMAARKTALLVRGDVKSPGPIVSAGWPRVFGVVPSDSDSATRQTRTSLADWLIRRSNPLTARVWVNRIWQWHFGRGLVETSSDFGTQGAEPSHPELLDYLASELMQNAWSTKHIHRLILTSAAYRQSSHFSEANAAIDPDNITLWRWTPRRLEAEAIRDSIRAVAGTLDRKFGGPSDAAESARRSLYIRQRRDALPHQQMLFDTANGNVSCARRRVSTTSLQPLWLLNSSFVQSAAKAMAGRVDSVAHAFELAVGRKPADDELATLRKLADEHGLASACLAILNSSEFLYIP